jgi:DNA-binding CsgD family transcriptional regulator
LDAAIVLPTWTTVVGALELLAGLAVDAQSYQEAARLFGAAETIRRSTGYQLCLSERDNDIASAGQALGHEGFEDAYRQGLALSVQDAVAYARRGRGKRKRPSIGWDSLTPTETKIVELVCQGRTNSQIGQRLFVSSRTVQTHLTHIFTKLSVTTRTELATKAALRKGVTPVHAASPGLDDENAVQ